MKTNHAMTWSTMFLELNTDHGITWKIMSINKNKLQTGSSFNMKVEFQIQSQTNFDFCRSYFYS